VADAKLEFMTLALRRALASDQSELAPVTAPQIMSYGPEDRTTQELQLALSELPDESRPTTVARLLLPDGVRLEEVEVEIPRKNLPGKLGRPLVVTVTVIVVPEPRPANAGGGIAGHWVFVPVLAHACFVTPKQDLAQRVSDEVSVLPAALALDLDGWKRLMSWAPSSLEPLAVELSTTPLSEAQGRKALAEQERRRLAIATLDGAGRRIAPPDAPPPVVGRDELLADLHRLLDGPVRRSVLLVGEEAAGKSALAMAWATKNPQRMMWATSAAELVAGASGLGEWQERVSAVIAAAEILDAIIYFDDFGALFADRPAEGGIELGAAIRRHVVDGRIRLIGELTPVALDRAERRDVSLIGAMLRLTVPPTDPDTTIDACRAWAHYWAKTQRHRAQIAADAIPLAVELARRYLPYRAFPGKAVRLLEELRVAHDQDRDEHGHGKLLGPSELYAAFSWSTGVPVALLADDKALAQSDVIAALRKRMIGQEAAVRRVAEAISVAKARLQPADKPLATLLFVGPTGTGKTELARSVASYLFGDANRMVRLDMSEYTDPWAAERLFGGDGGEGRLTSAVRSQPFGVVLLDEIEKAHPSVFDLLLQVLGEARLTDGRGRTTFFHNAIIVLTSNLGTRGAKGSLGLGRDHGDAENAERQRAERRYRDAVHGAFRPELVNRLDQIVVFHPLTRDEITAIARIAIDRLTERRGLTQPGVLLDLSPRALEVIAERGFSQELGARALRRYVDAAMLAPAARLLAKAGADGHGGTLTVRASDEPPVVRAEGTRIGIVEGDLVVGLYRRSAATGKRMVRSALALGEMRRGTDRDMAIDDVKNVRERIAEIAATLATAAERKDGRNKLSGADIARHSQQHARLSALLDACAKGRADLRVAEELCLEALARDIDAVELIDTAVAQRQQFRRHWFWLRTALKPIRPGATLLVHSPDARMAVTAYVKMLAAAAHAHGWPIRIHFHNEKPAGWKWHWGPAKDREWIEESFTPNRAQTAVLVRIAGQGADLLFGLEQGLHRIHGVAGEPAHVWVDLLEPRAEILDEEWDTLPCAPSDRPARGAPLYEVTVGKENVSRVIGSDVEIDWDDLPARLAERAAWRLALTPRDNHDQLWVWERPLQALEAARKTKKETP
jgi:ATP-dependent Clp protease ATP-binding subunit ClpC